MKKTFEPFTKSFKLDYEGLIRNLRREGTPDRVYFMELFLDGEVQEALDLRFGFSKDLDRNDPWFPQKRNIAIRRFLGYEYVSTSVLRLDTGVYKSVKNAEQGKQARKERYWINEHEGRIVDWDSFRAYPWPDGKACDTKELEWYEKNLPDDMCLVAHGSHFCEYLCWLMGYETLCYALADQRDLVKALAERILELEMAACRVVLQSKRVRIFWGSDDMGFKTGLMIGPADMREFVLSGHKRIAAMAHEAGRPYLLHACGRRSDIVEDLIEDVKLDAVHSWEDEIERITDAKRAYGKRLSLIGGMDVDFLVRSSERDIRKRVRETVEVCQPGGGFCLGSGNSVANYIPADHYLAMLDEGRKLSA